MAEIFLSYSSKDKDMARRLAEDMRQLGHGVWFDEWEIRVGDCILTGIERGLAGADFVCLLLSPHSVASPWVEREWKTKYWDEIEQRQVKILPVLLGDCERPPMLKTKRYADFRQSYGVGLVQLVDALRPAGAGPDQQALSPAAAPSIEAAAAPKLGEAEQAALLDWERRGGERFDWLLANEPPEELPDRYRFGTWSVTYGLFGRFEPPDERRFLRMLDQAQIVEPGWPAWVVLTDPEKQPYPAEDALECWLKAGVDYAPAMSDFWRATPSGLLYLKRGYLSDRRLAMPEETALPEPGTALFDTDPIWQVGEVLLHAERLSRQLAEEPLLVGLRFRWEGLRGRSLAIAPGRGGIFMKRRIASQATVSSPVVSLLSTEIQLKLVETVQVITRRLYRAFDFHEPEVKLIVGELRRVLNVDARMPDGTVPSTKLPF